MFSKGMEKGEKNSEKFLEKKASRLIEENRKIDYNTWLIPKERGANFEPACKITVCGLNKEEKTKYKKF